MSALSNKSWVAVKLFLGIMIIYLLSEKVKLSDIAQTLIAMKNPLLYITLSFLTLISSYILGAMCLYVLLVPIKRISLLKLFKYSSVSWAVGFLVPTADIISLSYLLKKEGINFGPGLVVNLLDKAITIFVLSVLTILSFIKFLSLSQTIDLTILLIALFIAMAFIISPTGRGLLRRFILRKYSIKFTGFWRVFRWYLLKKKYLIAINAVLTFLRLMITAVSTYIIFLAMGVEVSVYHILIISSTMLMIKFIPSPFSLLGLREGLIFSLAVFFYAKLGLSPAVIISTFIILVAFNYLYALLTIAFVDYKRLIRLPQN